MKLIILLAFLMISLPSWSTVTAGPIDCPNQFEGRVSEVIEPLGAIDSMSLNKVVIENRHTIKGDVKDQVVFDILKNGPFQIEPDHEYRVQLKDGRLCWIEEI